jgi:hypothetical protein
MKNVLLLAMTLLAVTNVFAQNYVQNGNFVETTTDETTGLVLPTGWDLDGNAFLEDGTWILNLVTSWLPGGAVDGAHALDLWRGTDEPYQLKLTQTINGLPDGVYTLSATAAFGGTDALLYVKIAGNEETAPMSPGGDYEKKEMSNIQITGGTAIIGFTASSSSSADWFDITGFELVKTGNLPTSIDRILPSGVSVVIAGNLIRVASEEPVLSVKLYSAEGKMIYSDCSQGREISFAVPQREGICILQVKQAAGTDTRKIRIR